MGIHINYLSVLYQIRKTPRTHATVDHTVHAPCVLNLVGTSREALTAKHSHLVPPQSTIETVQTDKRGTPA